MSLAETARAAEKKAQLARLAAKGSPDYPIIYAQQPQQLRIAAEQAVVRKARRDAKKALLAGAISDASGAVSAFATVKLTKGKK